MKIFDRLWYLKFVSGIFILGVSSFICNVCFASDWELISDNSVSDIYIRLDSSSGESWVVDLLINFRRPRTIGKTFRSSVDRMEFNCKTSKARTLTMQNYTGPMGTGSITFESTLPADWKPIKEGSVSSELFRVGCENRKSWL
jgi:hypothetical protein